MERTPWVIVHDVLDRALQHACDDTEDPVYEGEIREALQALEDLAEANRDRPWTADGPTREEAGSKWILVWLRSLGDPIPVPACWDGARGGWRTHDGLLLMEPQSFRPTGWRPMPKATHPVTEE